MKKVQLPNDVMLGQVRDLLREGHPVVIMTKGVSMLPFVVGLRDSVRLVQDKAPVCGDIALAMVREGVYVLHRVVEVKDGAVFLHGDGNLSPAREQCPPTDVCGTVQAIIRPDGTEVNPWSPREQRRWKLWSKTPVLLRRVFLGLYRRLKIKQI